MEPREISENPSKHWGAIYPYSSSMHPIREAVEKARRQFSIETHLSAFARSLSRCRENRPGIFLRVCVSASVCVCTAPAPGNKDQPA